MAAMGFTPEDYEETVEVWPENWQTWRLFRDCATQWRVAPMGEYIGLDYPPLFRLMDEAGLSREDWRDTFDDIRILEGAALEAMHAKT